MRSLFVLGAVAAASILSGCGTGALVEPGHRGLFFDPRDPKNALKHEVLPPGYYALPTMCKRLKCPRVDDFDVTFSTKREELTTNSQEGLALNMRMNVIYRPVISELYELDTEIGPNYYDEVVGPEFRSAARGVLAHHSYTELIAKNRQIEDEIEKEVRDRIHGKHVEIASVTFENIDYAPEIMQAVRAKLVGEQEAARQKAAMENEHARKELAIKNDMEEKKSVIHSEATVATTKTETDAQQAKLQIQSDAEQLKLRADVETQAKQHEIALVKAQTAIEKAQAEGEAVSRVARAKGQAQELTLLARAHAEENRAQTQTISPLTVQMHAYDALGKLGGEGTTVLLGEWSHVPNFLFPRAGAFLNAYGPPPVSHSAAIGANPAPSGNVPTNIHKDAQNGGGSDPY
jgi:regulator of protease activity HflC (stomatin/prohibitin superfamily)